MRKLSPLYGTAPFDDAGGLLFSPVSADTGGLDLMGQARRFIQQQSTQTEALNIQPLAAASLPMAATAAEPLIFGLPTFDIPAYQSTGSGSLYTSGGGWSGGTFDAIGGNTGVKLYGDTQFTGSGGGFNGQTFTLFRAEGPVSGSLPGVVPMSYEFTITDSGEPNTQIDLWTLTYSFTLSGGGIVSISTQGSGLGTFSNPEIVMLGGNGQALSGYSVTLTASISSYNTPGLLDFILAVPNNSIDFLIPVPPNTAPVAVDDTIIVWEDAMFNGNVLDPNPSTADSDADGNALTVTAINGLSADVDRPIPLGSGTVRLGADGKLVFESTGYDELGEGDQVSETFTYTIDDGQGGTASATVTVTIQGVDDPTTSTPVTLGPINEDSSLLITQAMLLANARDVDTPLEDLRAVSLVVTGLGSVAERPDGSWLYIPAPNDDTSDSISYKIANGKHFTEAKLRLDLLPVNDAPVAVADSAQTPMGTAVTIAVLANDSDVDGGPLTVSAITQGGSGSVAIRADGVSVRYTPNAGFSGFDTFTYTANDGAGGTAEGTVRVLVPSFIGTSGNDVPLGTANADFIVAGDGNDRVLTYGGADYVDGGRGLDTISGGLGADTLLGGDGADTFLTTAAELAGDSIDGGNQIDTLQITDPIAVMPAAFTLVNVEQLSFPGSLQVGHTALLDLSALTLTGAGNQINGGTANTRITGTRSNDRITDSAGNDDLRGGDGNDTIMAGVGQDTVHGGSGNDTLGGSSSTLGDGSVDTFVFNTALNALTNVDTIIGFEANSRDLIALDPAIFSAIGPTLEPGEFRSAAGGLAVDADDLIVYDPTTGALYYDADGNGAIARIQFATLGAGLTGTVDAADFVVSAAP